MGISVKLTFVVLSGESCLIEVHEFWCMLGSVRRPISEHNLQGDPYSVQIFCQVSYCSVVRNLK